MTTWIAVAGIVLTGASGLPGLFVGRRQRAARIVTTTLTAIGSSCGILGGSLAIFGLADSGLHLPWPVPGGEFFISIDGISAMFLLLIFGISFLASLYGLGCWREEDHPSNARSLQVFHGAMTAGMALLVVARNTILFLGAWEVMALATFMLVTTEDHEPAVREVGYIYLVATHVGTLCLVALFATLHAMTGTFTFASPASSAGPGAAAIFLLAVVGFGVKAGFMPLHVWLPGAHATAPSHVSALMSGVLLKMGIYGLIRISSLFPHPPLWWGGLFLGLGATSGILGVAFAIGQHDLKRLLAYHSIENIGIIGMGVGLALLGRSTGRVDLIVLGLGGALLHVWNHGLFKALLFFSAGSIVHATETRAIDRLGGLLRRMPWTALAFLVGAVAICGLPPLNGFVSELLVYLGLARLLVSSGRLWLAAALAIPALALIGALAVACFTKVFGIVFLGESRSPSTPEAHEASASMLLPMAVLASLCLLIGVGPALLIPVLERAVSAWAPEGASRGALAVLAPLPSVSLAALVLALLLAASALFLYARLRRGASYGEVGTWDCGYAAPSPRMQYTSSSYARGLVAMFSWALRPTSQRPPLGSPFPSRQAFRSHVPETVLESWVLPAARGVGRAFSWLHWLQRGRVQAYLLYILLTIVLLLLWSR